MNVHNATRYMAYPDVEKEIIRKLRKDPDLQDVAQAMESKKPWVAEDTKPTRTTSTIDIFI